MEYLRRVPVLAPGRTNILRKACCGLAVVVLADASAAGQSPPGVVSDRIFGPATSTGNCTHPASITELANGDLYLAYHGGDGGRSFPRLEKIAKGADGYAYPYAVQTRYGRIHVVATPERHTVIERYSFDETVVVGH